MRTERITFLTSADDKAALDAFASSNGMSVGHVVREATSRYIGEPAISSADEEVLRMVLATLNEAVPQMIESLDRSSEKLRATRQEIDTMLREAGIRK